MKSNKVNLYCEKKGSGDYVVLLHGFTLDTRMWDDQFDLLAKSYQVIRFDHRGHGQSEGIMNQFSQAEDLKSLLKSLGVDRAHIVGLSMGGLISIEFSIKYPEMVRSLVLVDSGATFDPSREFDKRVANYINKATNQGLEAGLKEFLADSIFQPAFKIPSVKEKLEKMILEGHFALDKGAFFLNALNVINPTIPVEARLNEIKAPTLVIVGDLSSPQFIENANRFSSDIPGAKKITISGVGHMSNMEKPYEFNEILLDFLSNQP